MHLEAGTAAPTFASAPPAPGLRREPLTTRILVVALTRDHGVEEVTERVRVVQRANFDVVLQRPQRHLNGMARLVSVGAGEAV